MNMQEKIEELAAQVKELELDMDIAQEDYDNNPTEENWDNLGEVTDDYEGNLEFLRELLAE